jgi:hypothetical protein
VPHSGHVPLRPLRPRYFGAPWTQVHRRSMTRGPCPRIVQFKNKSEICYFRNFAKRPLSSFEIYPQSIVFTKMPLEFGNNFRGVPSLRKIHKMARRNIKTPYLIRHNSKSNDSCAKIRRITPFFFLCIHIKHFCCILLIDYLLLLHVSNHYARAVLRGLSRPSLRGIPVFLRGVARQVPLIILCLSFSHPFYSM